MLNAEHLQRLLEVGLLTQEQYDALVLGEVTAQELLEAGELTQEQYDALFMEDVEDSDTSVL